jgi:2-dehydro-3-deoxy-D-arabinonate dehydratase
MYQLYRNAAGILAHHAGEYRLLSTISFDQLFTAEDPSAFVAAAWATGTPATAPDLQGVLLPPIGQQEVWAAGVTYFRSRTARMEESEGSGADRFYDLVYEADRPELFFKGNGLRSRGHGEVLRFRKDSAWNVPEPEFTLAINSAGKIFGYTIGNDMSSRDIEGENPLYLPQAKVYLGSLGLGPCLTICDAPGAETTIRIVIERAGNEVFSGETTLAQLKRPPQELAAWLFRENDFPAGCYLLTGTGIVPPGQWTLAEGDVVRISIAGLGELRNAVA